MRIAVCDDEKIFRDELKNAVRSYSNLHRLEIATDEYKCGEDLLEAKYEYEIIILDYKMDSIDGLETARRLREKNISSTIIFLTNFPKFVFDSFEVSPFRFFKKPLNANQLHKALDDYFNELRRNRPILLKSGRETICIQSNCIVFLEADNKKCYVNLFDKKLHIPKTMAYIEKLLPKNDFFKVHKAFIVNLRHICNYNRELLHLQSGDRVPTSRTYFNSFKEAYRTYVKDRST